MEAADQALREGDLIRFEAQVVRAEELLGCIDEALQTSEAATYHRLQAWSQWEPSAPKLGEPALRAAAASPDNEPLPAPAPGAAEDAPGRLPPPWRGSLFVDGVLTRDVPGGQAALVQHVVGEGVEGTWYMASVDAPPGYAKLRPRLTALGVGAGAVAIGALGGAYGLHQAIYNEPSEGGVRTEEWLNRARVSNNALVVTGGLLGGVSAASLAALGLSYVW